MTGRDCATIIREQRRRDDRIPGQNPSLKDRLPTILAEPYGDALLAAERVTSLPESSFPTTCPWPFEQVIDDGFWPEAVTQ
ncbi:DUF29 family protein [Rhodopila globiformis]|uniref:DUF29 domain-containing protein n=1 Tax=Rhodopila globiformis TaxID=1071 RepID=A0A2S6NGG6_RHOGL|nr:DUF29 family protein [Rhodopila globiformis]PPQ33706.1 hypothetical protein CCS01_13620 [Rhodopila globiformis]